MKLKQYLTEKRRRNVICCDIQPMYESSINFDLNEFSEFLDQHNNILYFYNGPETVGSDSEQDITMWLYDNGLNEDKFNDIKFIDKGYGFFRPWMDQGVDDRTMIQSIRYMALKKAWDSRDIDEEEWLEKFEDLDGIYFDDAIGFPSELQINKLKQWSGSLICGGGINECLKEVQLLMNAFNIKYTEVKKFMY